MKHNAGARIISHCNCGRKQGYRDEPFTIREANVGFYLRMEKDCCDNLDRIAFPIFSPTATAQLSLEDMLQILKTKSDVEPCIIKDKDFEEKQSFASQLMEIDLRQEENGLGDEGSASQSQENRDEAVEEIKNDLNLCSIDSGNSKPVLIDSKIASKSEFKSKSEYLPGMMHSKSPVGLLPKFSSWALLRLGSSRYNSDYQNPTKNGIHWIILICFQHVQSLIWYITKKWISIRLEFPFTVGRGGESRKGRHETRSPNHSRQTAIQ